MKNYSTRTYTYIHSYMLKAQQLCRDSCYEAIKYSWRLHVASTQGYEQAQIPPTIDTYFYFYTNYIYNFFFSSPCESEKDLFDFTIVFTF